MLTIKGNLKNHNLSDLCKYLIKEDIINFGLSTVGGGFTEAIADKVVAKLTLSKDKKILVINDITLQMVDKLLAVGYKKENIYLAFGKWTKAGSVSDATLVYNIMKAFIKANIKEGLKIISLKEIFVNKLNIDGVIANPPYGAIGANIVYNIREKIDYEQFVNLLPANDYKRNKTKDLFNYQSEMEAINDGFADAAVTTHLCLISKNKINNMTDVEFTRSQFIDRTLDKYFKELSNRKHYAIDAGITWLIFADNDNIKTTVLIDHRCIPHKHLAYSKNTDEYRWNKLENISIETMKAENKSASTPGRMNKYVIKVNTESEKINIVNFIYSKDGFRFLSKLFTGMNSDSTLDLNKFFPKVDWTRSWTVEKILRDYYYTENEIAEVMADLDNFKGMDD